MIIYGVYRFHSNKHRSLVVVQESKTEAEVGTEVPFELRGFSLATVALGLGGLITVGSLAEVSECWGVIIYGIDTSNWIGGPRQSISHDGTPSFCPFLSPSIVIYAIPHSYSTC